MNRITQIISNQRVHQVVLLYGSMLTTLVTSLAISVLNTHALGPALFGDLKFFQTLFAFLLTISTLGIFVTAGRLIAKEENEYERQKIIGVVLLLSLILTILIVFALLVLSMLEIDVFSGYRRDVLKYSLIFVVAVPLQYMLENILKGENKILDIALLRISPGLLYLIVGGALFYNNLLDLQLALNLYLATIACVALIVLIRLKPVLNEVLKVAATIFYEIKRYGFYVYQGTVANVGTTLLGSLFLALLVDTESMGYFVLARTVSAPLVQIAENIGIVFFRKFASIDVIPVKLFIIVIGLMILSLLGFLLLIGVFVETLYPEEFSVVIELAYITSIGSVAHGFGGFINNYLCAQGHGKKTRNAAFSQGATNLFGFIVLVYFFGMYGAAVTVVISAFVFSSMVLFYYFNLLNRNTG